ncbi:reduced folate transporter-like isoform X3 [Wyeomyia smithii]|nr:reduced folate transporter-like isoform X3 [Wyeomyia smithii]
MAAEVAYYTYIYAKIDRDKYQQVTGNTRAAVLSGRFLASVIGQALVSTKAMDLRQLNYITLGAQGFSLLWSFVLPSVKSSVYFYSSEHQPTALDTSDVTAASAKIQNDHEAIHRQPQDAGEEIKNDNHTTVDRIVVSILPVSSSQIADGDNPVDETNANLSQARSNTVASGMHPESLNDRSPGTANVTVPKTRFSCHRAGRLLWAHFTAAYLRNMTVVQWSLWWSLAMAGFIQVQIYVQLLWHEIDQDQEYLYNGGAEALLTLFGAISAIAAGYVANRIFEQWALWILTLCSALQGGLILYSGFSTNIWAAYVVYILFGVLYMFMITMASATVAKYLEEDSFGLIFGINTFIALAFQSILTVVVISESGLMLSPRDQFKVYGGYFLALALVYFIPASISSVRYCRRQTTEAEPQMAEGREVKEESDFTRF